MKKTIVNTFNEYQKSQYYKQPYQILEFLGCVLLFITGYIICIALSICLQ